MAKGSKCPNCKASKCHDKGSHIECDSCGYIGWGFSQEIKNVGKGRGQKCPWCMQLTLHDIAVLNHKHPETIRRCATCNYTAIEPPAA